MALLVHNISLGLDEGEDRLAANAARKLGVPIEAVRSLRVARKSLDARVRHMQWVYSVIVELASDQRGVMHRQGGRDVRLYAPPARPRMKAGTQRTESPPVVVGAGPAGLFAAMLLAEAGYRPIVLERGRDVASRHRDVRNYIHHRRFDPQSNLLFGEGGAGAYSDGKLYTRTHDPLVDWLIRRFVEFGAAADVAIMGKPHVGSDRLPRVCLNLRRAIEAAGGQVHFAARVEGLDIADGRVRTVRLADGERIGAGCVLLAVGHSARDTYRLLAEQGVRLSARPFQMGVRIEHPQGLIDRSQFGPHAGRADIGAADYHMVARGAGEDRDVFTFCMCPGGRVLPANSQEQTVCTNGGSRRARASGWANSALVTTVYPREFGDDPLEGLALQERIERECFHAAGGDYSLCAQRVRDFLRETPSEPGPRTSSLIGAAGCDLNGLLPRMLVRALHRALPMFEERIAGFAGPEAMLLGPETRASGPVRIDRDRETRVSPSADNLYPAGEGAGFAGGIVSSAVDGLRSAEAIIARYAPVR